MNKIVLLIVFCRLKLVFTILIKKCCSYRELKVKYLIIENFIPPDEKNKLLQRIRYDPENGVWNLIPLVPEDIFLEKRPVSCESERRPVSDYGRVAIKVGSNSRYQVCKILSNQSCCFSLTADLGL